MKLITVAAILLVSSLSCHESLPVRVDPGDIFDGFVEGQYILTATEHTIWLCMRVTNTFDETLQARLALRGEITIALASDTSVKRTFTLSESNITHGPYDRQSKILTIDPDSSLYLAVAWDFRDNYGTDIREDHFHFIADPACPLRFRCRKTFYLSGQVKVIERAHEAIFFRTEFTRDFANRFVNPRDCTPASFESQCY